MWRENREIPVFEFNEGSRFGSSRFQGAPSHLRKALYNDLSVRSESHAKALSREGLFWIIEARYYRGISSNRRCAISMYSGTQSMAMNFLPDFFATIAVVPAPENGSSTMPSFGQLAFKQVSTSDSG